MANRIPAELQPLINKMTNWQRNQWAAAGYPIEVAKVARFTRLQRDRSEVYAGEVLPPAKVA